MTVTMGDTFTEQDFITMMGEEIEDACEFYKQDSTDRCGKKATHLQIHSCCGSDYFRCLEHVLWVRKFLMTTPIVVCSECNVQLEVDKNLKFVLLES